MKKHIKKILKIVLILTVIFQILPNSVNAQTIAEFEKEVQKYTAELEKKKQAVITNENEVAKIKTKITSIENQISESQSEIKKLENEIDESNQEIKRKVKETEDIVQYYQVSEGNNPYLEYIFGADSVTDMIYRMSIVEQLTDANKKIMDELEILIKNNQKKTKELKSKENELNDLRNSLVKEKAKIYATIQTIRESMPTVEDQIKAAKENVKYYKNLGCGANEDIQNCVYRVQQASSSSSIPSTGTTLRPTITGIRNGGIGSYYGHIGQDIGSNNKRAETIYPVAAGIVLSVYNDTCYRHCSFVCNGNANMITIKHNINNQYIYATYIHLSTVSVSSGQYVSAYTPLGKMGNTGCTSGGDEGGTYIHLHLEMSTCHWISGGGCTYSQYVNRIINPRNIIDLPSWWNNR